MGILVKSEERRVKNQASLCLRIEHKPLLEIMFSV